MAKKGQVFRKYSPEHKLAVILYMREHGLSCHETMRKYFPHLYSKNFGFLKQWERNCFEGGFLLCNKKKPIFCYFLIFER